MARNERRPLSGKVYDIILINRCGPKSWRGLFKDPQSPTSLRIDGYKATISNLGNQLWTVLNALTLNFFQPPNFKF